MSEMLVGLETFKHIYVDKPGRVLVLLHGTGGDEHDLMPLVQAVGWSEAIVSLRGNVQEQGMNRFFRRMAPGVFDRESIVEETGKLAEFLSKFVVQTGRKVNDLVYLGYSNGANMILALMLQESKLVNRAILLHGMMPFEKSVEDMAGKKFLVSWGEQDQMIAPEESKKVSEYLQNNGAEVVEVVHPGGHEIRPEELAAINEFIKGE